MMLATCAASAGAQTTTPRAYAVVSEIARHVNLVSFKENTGSRLDSNVRQRLAVPDGALDKVILLTAQKALKLADSRADIWLLAPADSDFFGLQQISQGSAMKIPADLLAALRERKSTHLLIFTPYRAEADLQFLNSREGTGSLEGLGFYVDHQTPVHSVAERETSRGYLAVYAHFRATLVDVATQQVTASSASTANRITTTAGAPSGSVNPWDSLTSTQKMAQLRDLAMGEVDRMVPELVNKNR